MDGSDEDNILSERSFAVRLTFNRCTMCDTNTTLLGLFGTPLVAATFPNHQAVFEKYLLGVEI
jgi:hypothetical protein